jgi:hypothetical protein
MASLLLGPHSAPLHDDVAAYTFSFLGKEDLRNLACTSRRNQRFIKEKYPKYTQDAPKYKELTQLQKLQLEFIKFQDRPVWQRAAIVAVCVLFSPLILAYHSPKLIERFSVTVLAPLGKAVWNAAEAIAAKVYKSLLAPFGRGLRKVALLTYDYVLTPVGRAIYEVAKFVLVTVPKAVYRSVLKPFGRGVVRLSELTYDHVLLPLARKARSLFRGGLLPLLRSCYRRVLVPLAEVIKVVAEAVFVTFPSKVWQHVLFPVLKWTFERVLAPVGRAIFDTIRFVYRRVMVPLVNVIRVVAKGVFVTFPSKVWQHVLFPVVKWTFEKILVPVGKVLKVVLTGLCVTFPYKIYVHLLAPIGRAIATISQWTYDLVLTPVGKAIQSLAILFFQQVLIPTAAAIQFGATVLYENILIPTGMIIFSFSELIQRLFFKK